MLCSQPERGQLACIRPWSLAPKGKWEPRHWPVVGLGRAEWRGKVLRSSVDLSVRQHGGERRKVTSPAAGGQTNSFRGNGRSARTGNRSLQEPGAMVRRNEPGRLRARVCPALPLGAIALRSTAVRRGCSGAGFHGSGATPAKWGLHCQDTYQEGDARWRSTSTLLGQGDYQVAAGSITNGSPSQTKGNPEIWVTLLMPSAG
jgi:hypothetical protein